VRMKQHVIMAKKAIAHSLLQDIIVMDPLQMAIILTVVVKLYLMAT